MKPDDSTATVDPVATPPVIEAKAVWDDTVRQVKRLQELKSQRAVSDSEFDQAKSAADVAEARYASAVNSVREKIAEVDVAAADLALARQRLSDATSTAPFDGIVRARLVAPGTYVQVGEPLIELVRNSVLRFRGSLPERYARQMKVGQQLTLHVESLQEPVVAAISRISPSLTENNRSLMFEADVPNATHSLRSGLFAEATLELDPNAQAVVIPQAAVVRFAGIEKVWRVEHGQTQDVVVQLGRQNKTDVEILGGLALGDVIVADGSEGRIATVTSPMPVADRKPTEISEHDTKTTPSGSNRP